MSALTSNELFDAQVKHQIEVQRLIAGETRKAMRQLAQSDREIGQLLRMRLPNLRFGDPSGPRWDKLVKEITQKRKAVWGDYRKSVTALTRSVAVSEQAAMLGIVGQNMQALGASELTAVLQRPFSSGTTAARTLRQWFTNLANSDRTRIIEALRFGVIEGQSPESIRRLLIGTRRARFTDGILGLSRRNAETVIRTAMSHTVNASREKFFRRNRKHFAGMRWTAILDGRTTAVCRARDGKIVSFGSTGNTLIPANARPPAHPNCRSIMVGLRDLNEPLDEPTYEQWLRKQSAEFQDQVLGQAKGRLFRQGKVSLDKFVDRRGNELTLEEFTQNV